MKRALTEQEKGTIYIYNSRNRKKEKFIPVQENKVAMYTCGPTVYNYIHIGNARPLIVFDVIKKYFEYCGYEVKHVQNITDIDDRIIGKAIAEKTSTNEIANRYTKAFFDNCKALGTKKPDFSPKATDYVGEMISLINDLVKNDTAYEAEGNVFFDVSKDSQYGSFSGKDLSSLELGDRVDEKITKIKRNQGDFSLWKPAKPGEPSWDSPWGKGRPGWHTECVVMSAKLLGGEFDIHAGGVDLIFPHHENEIAQARCVGNPKFAKYWMHNEFVNIKDKKMAKSVGNVVLVNDLVKKYRKEAIRLFFLQTHYRKPISYDEKHIESAESAVESMYRFWFLLKKAMKRSTSKLSDKEVLKIAKNQHLDQYKKDAIRCMNEDFNTSGAIAEMFSLKSVLEQLMEPWSDDNYAELKYGHDLLLDLDKFLCIIPKDEKSQIPFESLEIKKIEGLIAERTNNRNNKEWGKADKIRAKLMGMGVVIEDTKNGTRWWSNK